MNYRNVTTFLGNLLKYVGLSMLLPLAIALYYSEPDAPAFALSAGTAIALGLALSWRGSVAQLSHRDAFAIVTLGWLAVALVGALPFSLSATLPAYGDAFFEAASGVTTTGASVMNNIEAAPRGILLWRSLLQWLGGMGFIVLSIAVLPHLAVGGMELFKAEVPTPIPERIKPRLRETALLLWRIYIILTVLLTILLWLVGMSGFEAFLNGLSTMATGGFSSRATSIAAYDNLAVELILTLFMILAGANFTLYYRALISHNVGAITKDVEFRVYVGILTTATVAIAWNLWVMKTYTFLESVRHASFQVTSILTTTGFASADFNGWPAFATTILFLLMFIGGSAGSTSGGVKILRHIVVVKHGYRELLRLIHPRALRPVRIGTQSISESVIARVLLFILLYLFLFAAGTLIITAYGVDLRTAASAVASSIGNIGPGFGLAGPLESYAFLAPIPKVILAILMIVGRLEIYTVLVLLLPRAWATSRTAPEGGKRS